MSLEDVGEIGAELVSGAALAGRAVQVANDDSAEVSRSEFVIKEGFEARSLGHVAEHPGVEDIGGMAGIDVEHGGFAEEGARARAHGCEDAGGALAREALVAVGQGEMGDRGHGDHGQEGGGEGNG